MFDALSVSSSIAFDYEKVKEEYNVDDTTYFLRKLAEHLDEGFQQATPLTANIDITTPSHTLSFVGIDNEGNYVEPASETEVLNTIASECARYWSSTVEPTGIPVSCSSITSVENDASKIEAVIAIGLLALGTKTEPVSVPYLDFVNVIFNAVKTIIWTVVESGPSPCNNTSYTSVV